MIKAILWDIGGVLLSNPRIDEFWKGINGSKELRNKFGTGEISVDEFIELGSKLTGISKAEFIKKYNNSYSSLTMDKGIFL
jgi:hypothetical protein